MGCGASTASPEPPKQLVLLGGGECGKTTIFKQIQILHGTGFKDNASMEWMPAIHRSPLRSMKVLLARLIDAGRLDAMDILKRASQSGSIWQGERAATTSRMLLM